RRASGFLQTPLSKPPRHTPPHSFGLSCRGASDKALAFLDYDLDERLDVFVANNTVPNFLFRNEEGGKFREAGLSASAEGQGVAEQVRSRMPWYATGLPL